MNAPDRFELFLLEPGEEKLTETINTSMSNTSDFTFKKEDHTLGNMLTEHLKQHPNVLMAGYKVSHPNVPEFFLRIQTDGKVTPKACLLDACRTILHSLGQIRTEFTREFELRRMVAAGEQQQNGEHGHGL
ncbi:hypothetical protein MCOR27_004390 [Pyricularia oryzae]|uniref:DNA-directed RNA polymerase RBP11-like dimerisation domain-containing protein n=3 Tax=Pyricularia TaxID=48558 RepID=A0ABQ8NV45_PYRGI|nr:uncharacterized protein MGG_02463 [Pyricularia oryzae 70-15]KAH8842584.1 hypothetical protein MCOR01_006487 [Pyricularia oryzae]KAI6302579.1 hypothetical protein MCOR33_002166 [Pyricularia grisea]TLD25542.1 hypothetical protein PspLS_06157 [Pyricularia sp. CBS 133598]EHA56645.1 hypothetical protein MGG_02463 [Pyricularia oryzae 70-15]KAH9435834.1 hypothetical protein MCOR02_004752 [Pyricularia oryzae]